MLDVCLISVTHFSKSIFSVLELGVNTSVEKSDDQSLDFPFKFLKIPVCLSNSCSALTDILL